MPSSRSCRMMRNSCATSLASRLDVGSSRISTWALMSMARAMATICWTASEYEPSGAADVDVEVEAGQQRSGAAAHLAPADRRRSAAAHGR